MTSAEPTSTFITALDGLRLHARCHGPRESEALPVVCLPGLTRTTDDFEPLASALAGDPARPRRVIALDYRGRGLSGYDPNPANYTLQTELADVLTVTAALGALPAIFIGTSRGGILSMLLGSLRPDAVAGVVLNDIGPVIERGGLKRIRAYVGKLPDPDSFQEAASVMRALFGAQFPRLTDADWLAAARRAYRRERERLVPTYDVRLAEGLAALDLTEPLPELWTEFEALARVPVLAIRGANSDLLSAGTLAAMAGRHPALETFEVPDQGHAPLLMEEDVIARIGRFVARYGDSGPNPLRSHARA